MIGINKNNNDYIVVKSSKLGDVISNYQEFITGLESIINNYHGYYVIYGDGTLISRAGDFEISGIHPADYRDLVHPKLNRYQIQMSKEIFRISDNRKDKEIIRDTPENISKFFKKSKDELFYNIRNFEGIELESCFTKSELLEYLDKLGANIEYDKAIKV